jgi:hypothetical protein
MEMMANLLVTPLVDGGFGFDHNVSGAAAAIATAGTVTDDYDDVTAVAADDDVTATADVAIDTLL